MVISTFWEFGLNETKARWLWNCSACVGCYDFSYFLYHLKTAASFPDLLF